MKYYTFSYINKNKIELKLLNLMLYILDVKYNTCVLKNGHGKLLILNEFFISSKGLVIKNLNKKILNNTI